MATDGSSTASRRGEWSGFASPRSTSMPRFPSASTTPSNSACASPGSALTGSSSVPSSMSRDVVSDIDRKPLALESSPSRSEEHTSELQSLMRNSYAVFCLKKKKNKTKKVQIEEHI